METYKDSTAADPKRMSSLDININCIETRKAKSLSRRRQMRTHCRSSREKDQLKDELNGFKRENQEIRKELNTLKMKMEQSKQKDLKSNIVVTGIPVTLNTDIKTLNSVVMKIAGKLNMNLNEKDFVCSKIGKDTSKQIKVKFHNSEKKDKIMEAKKRFC
ncbi:hypothetical protein WA026_015331 [Henosepilachna vigintioctopunctata]|uniref:Uncharacterized protein n=1 Tax=Henosepilachna vigintioctopunctata TaxID=420089 RepID=A0AAW1UKI6_9CUCU